MSGDPRQAILAALDKDDSWARVYSDHPEIDLRRNAGVRAVVEHNTEHVAALPKANRDACTCHGCHYVRLLADAHAPGWDA